MLKRTKRTKTWLKKIAFMLFVIVGLTVGVVAAHVSDPTHDNVVDPGYDPEVIGNTVQGITGDAWATISMLVMVFAVACIVVTGLRYMMASADRKADLKQSSAYIVVGCILVFATMPIINLVTNVGKEVIGTTISYSDENDSYRGNDEVIEVVVTAKTVKNGAFRNCKNLKTVKFAEGVETIEDIAFENCVSLEEIILPSTIKYVGKAAFRNCTSAVRIAIKGRAEDAEHIDKNGQRYYTEAGVEIDTSAFEKCNSAAKFGLGNFIYFSSIGSNAFKDCTELQGFYNFINNTNIGAADIALKFCSKGEYSIHTSFIESGAFKNTKITNLILGTENRCLQTVQERSILNVKSDVMDGNTSLEGIYVRSGAYVTFETGAFDGHESLKIIKVQGRDVTFAKESFANASALETLIITPNVTVDFEDNAFYNCQGLKTVTIDKNSTITFGNASFKACSNIDTFTFGDNSTITFNKESFAGAFAEHNSNLTIGNNANVTFGENSFYQSNLDTLDIAQGNQTWGENEVSNANNITFGKEAFKESGIYDVKIDQGNKIDIGQSAFENCYGLNRFYVHFESRYTGRYNYSMVSSIGENAFANCNSMLIFGNGAADEAGASIIAKLNETKPAGATIYGIYLGTSDISKAAFYGCSSLEQVGFYVPNASQLNIGDKAFASCYAVTNFDMAGNPTRIVGLKRILFSGNDSSDVRLGTVGNLAFQDCQLFKGIESAAQNGYKNSDKARLRINGDIGIGAFKNCKNLVDTVYFYGETVYQSAFESAVISEFQVAGDKGKVTIAGYTTSDPVVLEDVTYYGAFYNSKVETLTANSSGNNTLVVGPHAFVGSDLTTINSQRVVEVQLKGFEKCNKLSNVTMKFTSLGQDAFLKEKRGCPTVDLSLEGVVINNTNPVIHDQFKSWIANLTISGQNVQIADNAFDVHTMLQNISLSDNTIISTIGTKAFWNCTNLAKVDIGGNVVINELGTHAFSGCTNLTKFGTEKPVTINTINSFAFSNVANSKKDNSNVIFGEDNTSQSYNTCQFVQINTKSIDAGAFNSARIYDELKIKGLDGEICSISNLAFDGINDTLYLMSGNYSLVAGSFAGYGSTVLKLGTGTAFESIPQSAFKQGDKTSGIEKIVGENNAHKHIITNKVYAGAFEGTNIETLKLSAVYENDTIVIGVNELGEPEGSVGANPSNLYIRGNAIVGQKAFTYKNNLKNVYFENWRPTVASNIYVREGAFSYCANLQKIYVKGRDTLFSVIAMDAFLYCTNLLGFYDGNNTPAPIDFANLSYCYIGESAFSNCESLEHMHIRPAGNDSEESAFRISSYAFKNCAFDKITFDSYDSTETNYSIYENAIYDCGTNNKTFTIVTEKWKAYVTFYKNSVVNVNKGTRILDINGIYSKASKDYKDTDIFKGWSDIQ